MKAKNVAFEKEREEERNEDEARGKGGKHCYSLELIPLDHVSSFRLGKIFILLLTYIRSFFTQNNFTSLLQDRNRDVDV